MYKLLFVLNRTNEKARREACMTCAVVHHVNWSEKSLNTLKICIMYQLKVDVDKLNAVKVVVS